MSFFIQKIIDYRINANAEAASCPASVNGGNDGFFVECNE